MPPALGITLLALFGDCTLTVEKQLGPGEVRDTTDIQCKLALVNTPQQAAGASRAQ